MIIGGGHTHDIALSGFGSTSLVRKFNIETKTWTTLDPVAESGLIWLTMVSKSGYVYVIGGEKEDGTRLSRIRRTSEVINSWNDDSKWKSLNRLRKMNPKHSLIAVVYE